MGKQYTEDRNESTSFEEEMCKKRKRMWLEYKIATELLYVGSVVGILIVALLFRKLLLLG